MKSHFAKRIGRCLLHSQTVQEILERLDNAYIRFFKHFAVRPPKFKKVRRFSSFLFKQGGFKLDGNKIRICKTRINKISKTYKFSLSREYQGKVKTVKFKRSPLGEYYIIVTTDAVDNTCGKSHNGASYTSTGHCQFGEWS